MKGNRTKERVDSQAKTLVFIIKDWWVHILKRNEKIEEKDPKPKKGTTSR